MCPHCGQNAPIVYRGVVPHCTACGRVVPHLSDDAVNFAGKTSKWGGALAGVLGWLVLGGGSAVALLLGWILQALWPAGIAGYVVGVPLGLVSLAVGLALLVGGRTLHRSGIDAQRRARENAVFALAAHRGGIVTPLDVSQSLRIAAGEAEAMLTTMAKEQSERVSLEVDDNGALYYRVGTGIRIPSVEEWNARVRVQGPPPAEELFEVDAQQESATGRSRSPMR